jgi:hypothetical protein
MKSFNPAYPPPPNPPARELSPYDRLVLDQVRQGRSSRQIAGKRKNIAAGIKKVDRVVDKLVRRFNCVSRHGVVRRLRQENPGQIPDAKSGVKFTKAEDLIIGFVARGFTDRKIVEILKSDALPSSQVVVECTGLASCYCGGKSFARKLRKVGFHLLLPAGTSLTQARRKLHGADAVACTSISRFPVGFHKDKDKSPTRASTEGVIENYLVKIYDKLGWSRSAGRVNRIKLALFYEDRLYASLQNDDFRRAHTASWIKIWKQVDQSENHMKWLRETEAIRENRPRSMRSPTMDSFDRDFRKRVLLRVFYSLAPSAEDQVNKMGALALLVEIHRTLIRQERSIKIWKQAAQQKDYMRRLRETEAAIAGRTAQNERYLKAA